MSEHLEERPKDLMPLLAGSGPSEPSSALPANIAEMINEEYHKAQRCYEDALNHAMAAGAMLTAKKDELPHGEFQFWVEENCDFSYRTAADYMKLHRERDRLEEAKVQHAASLSIRGALKAIAPPTPEKKQQQDKSSDRTFTPKEMSPEARRDVEAIMGEMKHYRPDLQDDGGPGERGPSKPSQRPTTPSPTPTKLSDAKIEETPRFSEVWASLIYDPDDNRDNKMRGAIRQLSTAISRVDPDAFADYFLSNGGDPAEVDIVAEWLSHVVAELERGQGLRALPADDED